MCGMSFVPGSKTASFLLAFLVSSAFRVVLVAFVTCELRALRLAVHRFLNAVQAFLDHADMCSQCALEFVHAGFVLFKIVYVVFTEIVERCACQGNINCGQAKYGA